MTASTTPATFNVQTTINNIVAGNSQNTYNLTTGVDTLTGGTGNNVFNAILDNATGLTAGGQATTLQSFDSITGGTLNNTLNITDFGQSYFMTIPSGAAISGITTVNVNTLESIGSSPSTPVDFSALGANMAAVKFQLHRLSRGKRSDPKVSPLRALILQQVADVTRTRAYRRWMMERAKFPY